jgi:hypothetical protein
MVLTGAYMSIHNGVDAVKGFGASYHELTPGVAKVVQLPAHENESVWAVSVGRPEAGSFSFNTDSGSAPLSTQPAGVSGADSEATPIRPPTTVVVTDPRGAPVVFAAQGAHSSSRWSLDAKSGIKVGEFRTTAAGGYRIEVTFPDASIAGAPLPARAAVGALHIGHTITRIVLPVAIGGFAGLGTVILLALLRGASKRRRRLARATDARSLGVPSGAPASAAGGPPAAVPPPPPPPLPGHDGPISFH